MRARYWSNGKLADRIRGVKKPKYATMEEWNVWEAETKKAHPFGYWAAEEFLDTLQDIVYFIPDTIGNIRYYFINRYIEKSHALTSKLPRGKYYDFDTRLLNCLFDELVNFVEIEKAHMDRICNPDKYKGVPRRSRSATAGIDYLTWETTLVNEYMDSTDPDYMKPSSQAIVAKWVLDTYHWWTVTRPNRPDPYDISGFSEATKETEMFTSYNNVTREMLDELNRIEAEYQAEDTQKLIELINNRAYLWT